MATHSKERLPYRVELVVSADQQEDARVIPFFWDSEQEIDRHSLLEVREMVPLQIDFHATQETVVGGRLLFDTSRFNEEGEAQPIEVDCSPRGQMHTIYKRGRSEESEFPWRMGFYLITVHIGGKAYYSGIQVTPNNLTLEQVQWIHHSLEEQAAGICYELILSQRGYADEFIEETPDKWYYDYVRWLLNEKQGITACIEYIRRHIHEEVQTQYRISTKFGKQDLRTERWSQSYSGIAFNQGVEPAEFHLERRKHLEVNNPQNQWIKFVIHRWKAELSMIHELLEQDLASVNRELAVQEERKVQLELKIHEISSISDVPEGLLRDQKGLKHAAINQINKLTKWGGTLQRWSQIVVQMSGIFAYLLHAPAFHDIEISGRKPLVKNRYYHLLTELFEKGNHIKHKEGDVRQYKSILWPTWRIYEYFCLFQILKALQELGFRPVDGLPDSVVSLQSQGIEEGSEFIFAHETGEIRIHFGTKIVYSPDDAEQSRGFYSQNEHRWPDMRLDFYETVSGDLRYSNHSLVFDSKLSKFRWLAREGLINKAYHQMNAYSHIQHVNSLRAVVDRVCCLYSGFGDTQESRRYHSLTYILLRPERVEDGRGDSFVRGFNALVEFIRDWLYFDLRLDAFAVPTNHERGTR
jgi:hypothetical protein